MPSPHPPSPRPVGAARHLAPVRFQISIELSIQFGLGTRVLTARAAEVTGSARSGACHATPANQPAWPRPNGTAHASAPAHQCSHDRSTRTECGGVHWGSRRTRDLGPAGLAGGEGHPHVAVAAAGAEGRWFSPLDLRQHARQRDRVHHTNAHRLVIPIAPLDHAPGLGHCRAEQIRFEDRTGSAWLSFVEARGGCF